MEKSIAKDLLSIGAVFLRPEQPFTWASGIKSPIYCDNRLTLTAPVVRGHVEEGLAQIVRTRFPEAEVLMGTSTAGIAHAAITATILDLPMGYVRSGSKDHGRGNQIEGKLEKGQKVVVIEDLTTLEVLPVFSSYLHWRVRRRESIRLHSADPGQKFIGRIHPVQVLPGDLPEVGRPAPGPTNTVSSSPRSLSTETMRPTTLFIRIATPRASTVALPRRTSALGRRSSGMPYTSTPPGCAGLHRLSPDSPARPDRPRRSIPRVLSPPPPLFYRWQA